MSSSMFFGTWYSIIPPLLAIILAFATKEVYSSLFIGAFVGAFLYANFNTWGTCDALFSMMEKNMDIKVIIFTIMLGMIAVLLKKSGGSQAYGKFALQKLKTRKLNRSIRSFIKDRQDELNKIFKQEDMPSDRIVSYDRFMQIFDEVGIKLKKEYMEVLLYQMKVAVTKVRSMHDFNMIVVVDFLK